LPLPSDLRALHGRGERRSPDMGVQQDAPTNETIVPVTFWEIIKFLLGKNSWRPFSSRIP